MEKIRRKKWENCVMGILTSCQERGWKKGGIEGTRKWGAQISHPST